MAGKKKKEGAKLSAVFHACEFAVALAVIAAALWAMMSPPASFCLLVYQAPMLVAGGVLLLAALVGLMGLACDHGGLKCLHVTLAILALLGLLAFSIFAFIVTAGGASSSSHGQTVYEPVGFSSWMQQQLGSWSSLQACLANTVHVCSDLRQYTRDKLQGKQISPLEAGCCLPPDGCPVSVAQNNVYAFAFALPNAPTVTTPTPANQPGCNAFSIDPATLCYSCPLCQGGLLNLLQSNLKIQAYVSTAAAAVLLVLGLAMCCATCQGAEPHELSESDGIALARAPTFVMVDPTLERTLTRVNTGVGGASFKRINTMASAAGGGGGGAQFERTMSRVDKGLANGPGGASFQRALTFQSMASAEYKRQMSHVNHGGGGAGGEGMGDEEDGYERPILNRQRSRVGAGGGDRSSVLEEDEDYDGRTYNRQRSRVGGGGGNRSYDVGGDEEYEQRGHSRQRSRAGRSNRSMGGDEEEEDSLTRNQTWGSVNNPRGTPPDRGGARTPGRGGGGGGGGGGEGAGRGPSMSRSRSGHHRSSTWGDNEDPEQGQGPVRRVEVGKSTPKRKQKPRNQEAAYEDDDQYHDEYVDLYD
ncbi:hypothetical protein CLOP_g20201 [Closterium sp. NIES-67]|nr:hypothetical protein CLOP_g20201 [Closterium sp. NIES-67]